MAKARAENAMGCAVAEGESLLVYFFKAEKRNVDFCCPALEEHVTESIHLYNQIV